MVSGRPCPLTALPTAARTGRPREYQGVLALTPPSSGVLLHHRAQQGVAWSCGGMRRRSGAARAQACSRTLLRLPSPSYPRLPRVSCREQHSTPELPCRPSRVGPPAPHHTSPLSSLLRLFDRSSTRWNVGKGAAMTVGRRDAAVVRLWRDTSVRARGGLRGKRGYDGEGGRGYDGKCEQALGRGLVELEVLAPGGGEQRGGALAQDWGVALLREHEEGARAAGSIAQREAVDGIEFLL